MQHQACGARDVCICLQATQHDNLVSVNCCGPVGNRSTVCRLSMTQQCNKQERVIFEKGNVHRAHAVDNRKLTQLPCHIAERRSQRSTSTKCSGKQEHMQGRKRVNVAAQHAAWEQFTEQGCGLHQYTQSSLVTAGEYRSCSMPFVTTVT